MKNNRTIFSQTTTAPFEALANFGRAIPARSALLSSLMVCLLSLMVLALPVNAQQSQWSAKRAHKAVQQGELILLDLRTPEEWRETGVPDGAWPINLYDRNFGGYLRKVIDRNPQATIGLICATGGRSEYVLKALQRNGVTNFVDIAEGVLGSPSGPGWQKAGLPLVSTEEAMGAMPADFRHQ